MMNENPKTTCAAFGCHRWTRRFPAGFWYLCPGHWQMVPRQLRLKLAAAKRRAKKTGTNRDQGRASLIGGQCIAAADRNLGM